ncbi:MAG: hypothetical protein RBG13Loki_4380 [Promethearchaeota archaeon CR_4]|nr:MAG: hypothetical protein RBG13Loki_4380 [Candidatus Lokiarchaeota archaeon CR_4]
MEEKQHITQEKFTLKFLTYTKKNENKQENGKKIRLEGGFFSFGILGENLLHILILMLPFF